MIELLVATVGFVAVHSFVSGTSLRAKLVDMIGVTGFRIAFSVASLVLIVAMSMSYNGALAGGVLVGRRLWLRHRDLVFDGERLDRARRQLLAAAGRAIRLSQHRARPIAAIKQRSQRRGSKLRCASKNDSR